VESKPWIYQKNPTITDKIRHSSFEKFIIRKIRHSLKPQHLPRLRPKRRSQGIIKHPFGVAQLLRIQDQLVVAIGQAIGGRVN
jgi:hypothetical protein